MLDSIRNLNKVKRSKQELILMLLSGSAALGLIPFVILRIRSGDWTIAILDMCLFLVFTTNGLYVYKTSKIEIPRLTFALLLVVSMFVGFYIKGVGQLPWSYPALVAIFFAVRPKLAALLCLILITWFAKVLFPLMEIFEYTIFLTTLSTTCLFVFVFANLTRQQHKALLKLSRRDPLTNLRNRRAFDTKIEESIGSIRNQLKTCLLLFDIDHFKKINDELGHDVGDQVLRKLGEIISSRMRRTDYVYRIGGEEFAIILSNSNSNNAYDVAVDILGIVEQSNLVNDRKITVSLGIAEYCEKESKESWYKRCDQALYLAKQSGRNNVKTAKNRPVC